MGNRHNHSFFGQNTGLIINTSSKNDPFIFIRCIKKKPSGVWENQSAGEGKIIKCSLEEIVMILQVLNRKIFNWTSYHTYKDEKTTISFEWEDHNTKTLWINIANYSKMLNFGQIEILRLLMSHILNEKIIYATSLDRDTLNNKTEKNYLFNEINDNINDNKTKILNYNQNYTQPLFEEKNDVNIVLNKFPISKFSIKTNLFRNMSNIKGAIKGETEKALLIAFDSGKEIWIPKSTIHCQYAPRKNLIQKFLIDNWILNKNKISI